MSFFFLNSKPNYSQLKVFGCLCFPHLRPYNKHKLDFRSSLCTFLGYSSKHKGYKCLNQQGRMFISRSVIFAETKFPFANKLQKPVQTVSHSTLGLPCIPLVKNLGPISVS